jgi:hypothetical protein
MLLLYGEFLSLRKIRLKQLEDVDLLAQIKTHGFEPVGL